jgi:hypothetical protein
MTFLELRTELAARGFSHLSATRLGLLINRARARLDGMHTWPYREASATGTATLLIPTLGIVEAVGNETQNYPLEEIGYKDLVDCGADLALAGSPQYWYRTYPSGQPVVATYPTSSSDSIGVQFWAITPDLTADGDLPEAPDRYHLLYVDIAQQAAERDRGNHAAAQALQPEVDRQVTEMVEDLLQQQAAKYTRMTWASEDN